MPQLNFVVAVGVFGLSCTQVTGAPLRPPAQTSAEVQVIGVYEGGYPAGVRHAGGFHPDGAVTIRIAEVQKPIILVLTSYEPVVWTVEAPKGAVVRVIASGYYKQSVKGLDKSVPVTLISHEAGDKEYFYAYRQQADAEDSDHERGETNRKYNRLVERVKALTNQDIKKFRGAYAKTSFEFP